MGDLLQNNMKLKKIRRYMEERDDVFLASPWKKWRLYGKAPWRVFLHLTILLLASWQVLVLTSQNTVYFTSDEALFRDLFVEKPELYTINETLDSFRFAVDNYYNFTYHTISNFSYYDPNSALRELIPYLYESNEVVDDPNRAPPPIMHVYRYPSDSDTRRSYGGLFSSRLEVASYKLTRENPLGPYNTSDWSELQDLIYRTYIVDISFKLFSFHSVSYGTDHVIWSVLSSYLLGSDGGMIYNKLTVDHHSSKVELLAYLESFYGFWLSVALFLLGLTGLISMGFYVFHRLGNLSQVQAVAFGSTSIFWALGTYALGSFEELDIGERGDDDVDSALFDTVRAQARAEYFLRARRLFPAWDMLYAGSLACITLGSIFLPFPLTANIVYSSGLLNSYWLLGIGLTGCYVSAIRYFEFSYQFYMPVMTLRRAVIPIVRFIISVAPIFFAYALLGVVLFGEDTALFATIGDSCVTLFSLMCGDTIYGVFTLDYKSEVMAQIFLFSFLMLFMFSILNMFIAIITSMFGETRSMQDTDDAVRSVSLGNPSDSTPLPDVVSSKRIRRRTASLERKRLSIAEAVPSNNLENDFFLASPWMKWRVYGKPPWRLVMHLLIIVLGVLLVTAVASENIAFVSANQKLFANFFANSTALTTIEATVAEIERLVQNYYTFTSSTVTNYSYYQPGDSIISSVIEGGEIIDNPSDAPAPVMTLYQYSVKGESFELYPKKIYERKYSLSRENPRGPFAGLSAPQLQDLFYSLYVIEIQYHLFSPQILSNGADDVYWKVKSIFDLKHGGGTVTNSQEMYHYVVNTRLSNYFNSFYRFWLPLILFCLCLITLVQIGLYIVHRLKLMHRAQKKKGVHLGIGSTMTTIFFSDYGSLGVDRSEGNKFPTEMPEDTAQPPSELKEAAVHAKHARRMILKQVQRLFSFWDTIYWVAVVLIAIGSVLLPFPFKFDVVGVEFRPLFFIGLGTSLCTLATIRYLEYSVEYYILVRALSVATAPTIRFLVSIAPLYVGYAFLGLTLFSNISDLFSSFSRACVTLFALLCGDNILVTFNSLTPAGLMLSRVYVYSFIGIFIFAVLNMFIAIIEEVFDVVRETDENPTAESSATEVSIDSSDYKLLEDV